MGTVAQMRTRRSAQQAAWHAAQTSTRPESVSMTLRNARILAGYDVSEVASALRIRPAHLEALEDGRFTDLPPFVYAQGFVAACADYLHLNKADMLARFKAELEAQKKPSQPEVSALVSRPASEHEKKLPSLALIGAGFVLVLLIYGLFQAAQPDRRDAALAVPPLPERLQSLQVEPLLPQEKDPPSLEPAALPQPAPMIAPASPVPTSLQPLSQPAPQPAPLPAYTGAGVITLKAHGDGWIQVVSAQGERLESLVLKAGETYRLPSQTQGLSLITGDISTIEFIVDQQTVSVSASSRRTRYQVLLDPARLVAGQALVE